MGEKNGEINNYFLKWQESETDKERLRYDIKQLQQENERLKEANDSLVGGIQSLTSAHIENKNTINKLQAELDKYKWISVETEPKDADLVNIAIPDGYGKRCFDIDMGYYMEDEKQWYNRLDNPIKAPAYWLEPIPPEWEPPPTTQDKAEKPFFLIDKKNLSDEYKLIVMEECSECGSEEIFLHLPHDSFKFVEGDPYWDCRSCGSLFRLVTHEVIGPALSPEFFTDSD